MDDVSRREYDLKEFKTKPVYFRQKPVINPDDWILHRSEKGNKKFDFKAHEEFHYGRKHENLYKKYEMMWYKEKLEEKRINFSNVFFIFLSALVLFKSDLGQLLFM